jgi:uncharacterized protein YecE (DUF72 family)
LLKDVTSNFIYVRLHGDEELYASGYSMDALRRWAEMIRAWSAGGDAPGVDLRAQPCAAAPAGRDVYVYFDNDVKTHAPYDAMHLAHLLGLRGDVPEGPPPPLNGRYEAVRTTWIGWGPQRESRRNRRSTAAPRKSSPASQRSTKGPL